VTKIESDEVLRYRQSMNIFIARDGTRQGPYSTDQLRDLIRRGDISLSEKAWYEGCVEWIRISEMPEVLDQILPPIPESTPTKNRQVVGARSIGVAKASHTCVEATQGAGPSGNKNASRPTPPVSEPLSIASAIPAISKAPPVHGDPRGPTNTPPLSTHHKKNQYMWGIIIVSILLLVGFVVVPAVASFLGVSIFALWSLSKVIQVCVIYCQKWQQGGKQKQEVKLGLVAVPLLIIAIIGGVVLVDLGLSPLLVIVLLFFILTVGGIAYYNWEKKAGATKR
jgi:hypothetical protein